MRAFNQQQTVIFLIVIVILSYSVIFPTGVGLASFNTAEPQTTTSSTSSNTNRPVLNLTFGSNDSIIREGEEFTDTNTSTIPLNGTKSEAHTVYIPNSSFGDKSYSRNETVINISDILHSSIEFSTDEAYLQKFGMEYLILDSNSNYELDNDEIIFYDENQDYSMSVSDSIQKSGNAKLIAFRNTPQNETYFGPNSKKSDSYDIGEVVVSLNQTSELERGKLNTGNSTVLSQGSAPILGFDDTSEHERVFDVISDSGSVNLDYNESILTSGSSDYVTAGDLSSGDDEVLKPGRANLTKFQKNETFILDVKDPSLENFNEEEALISDIEGGKSGELDGADDIIKGGKGPCLDARKLRINGFFFGWSNNEAGKAILRNALTRLQPAFVVEWPAYRGKSSQHYRDDLHGEGLKTVETLDTGRLNKVEAKDS